MAHVNFVAPSLKEKGVDARKWAQVITDILGGKAGGKEESAQGVGSNVARVDEAVNAAKEFLAKQ